MGVKAVNLWLSVEDGAPVDGVMVNEVAVDALNRLAPARFGAVVKVGARGLSMEVEVSEPNIVLLARAGPLARVGCGGNDVVIWDDCSA